jgi:hypothetical protein
LVYSPLLEKIYFTPQRLGLTAKYLWSLLWPDQPASGQGRKKKQDHSGTMVLSMSKAGWLTPLKKEFNMWTSLPLLATQRCEAYFPALMESRQVYSVREWEFHIKVTMTSNVAPLAAGTGGHVCNMHG